MSRHRAGSRVSVRELATFRPKYPLPIKRAFAIPPGAFVFVQVTTPDKTGGGWWTTCLHMHLKRTPNDDADRAEQFTCDAEIGIPIVTTTQGRISQRRAQEVAAEVVNKRWTKCRDTGA